GPGEKLCPALRALYCELSSMGYGQSLAQCRTPTLCPPAWWYTMAQKSTPDVHRAVPPGDTIALPPHFPSGSYVELAVASETGARPGGCGRALHPPEERDMGRLVGGDMDRPGQCLLCRSWV